ncbi:hypothetical protein ACU4GH_29755 [Bradyrhizobium betae]
MAYTNLTGRQKAGKPAFLLAETARMMEESDDAARAVIAPEHPAGMRCAF